MTLLGKSWDGFYKNLTKQNKNHDKMLAGLMTNTINGFARTFGSAIAGGKSLTKALGDYSKQVLSDLISMYVKMGIQRLITGKLIEGQTIKEAMLSFAATGAKVFGNVYSSISAIPIVGPVLAPAAAAAAFAFVGSKVASISGIAHGGLTNVPEESTYLLNKGERVLSPNQNRDFTDFINSARNQPDFASDGISSGSMFVVDNINIEVLPNATSADSLLNMDKNELKEIVAGPIIEAFNELDNEGVRPNFIERQAI